MDYGTKYIDIGIKCKNGLGKTRYKILNAIDESNVPYKVDLVDLNGSFLK